MKSSHRSRVCIVCVFLGLVSGLAHAAVRPFVDRTSFNTQGANRPWGQIPPPTPGIHYNETTPGYGQQGYSFSFSRSYGSRQPPAQNWSAAPQQNPYYAQPGSRTASAPYVETALQDSSPMLQQAVLFTLRVASAGNLRTIDVELPQTDGVTFQKLDGPVTSSRTQRGRREIVNEYHYILTPLREGELSVPPVRVTGTLASDQQWNAYTGPGASHQDQSFDIRSNNPMRLQVTPANSTVRPWLPARNLTMRGGVDAGRGVAPGDPLTLSVELVATGAAGEQLPSLETQLQNAGFRAYREDQWARTEISKDGKNIIGRHSETYTLVPNQDGGSVQLPQLRVAWWNTDTGTVQYAALTGNGFAAGAPLAMDGAQTASGLTSPSRFFPWASPMAFWAPLLLVAALFPSYWILVWGRGRGLGRRAKSQARAVLARALGGIGRSVDALWARVAPVQCCRSITHYLAAAMPDRLMVWFCARCAGKASDPTTWCRQIRGLMCRHMDMPRHAPLQAIADKILQLQPRPETAKVYALMHDLDGAIYGRTELDFEAWKKSFGRQVSPVLMLRSRRRRSGTLPGLPELNPRMAA